MGRQAIDQAIEAKYTPGETSKDGRTPLFNSWNEESKLPKRKESSQDFYQSIISAAAGNLAEPSAAQAEVTQLRQVRNQVRLADTASGPLSALPANEAAKQLAGTPKNDLNSTILLAQADKPVQSATSVKLTVTDKIAVPGQVAGNCLPTTSLSECRREPGRLPAAADRPSEVKVVPPAAATTKQDLAKAPLSDGGTPVVLPIPPVVVAGTEEPGSSGAESQKKAPDAVSVGHPEVSTGAPNAVALAKPEAALPAPKAVAPEVASPGTSTLLAPGQKAAAGTIVTPQGPAKQPNETLIAAPQVPAKQPNETPIVAPQVPAKQPNETPIAAPQVPAKQQGEMPIAAPQVPAKQQGEMPIAAPQVPAKQPNETPIVAPQVPAKQQGETPIAAPQVPAKQQGETPIAAPQAPAKQLVEAPVALSPAPVKVEVPAQQPIETLVAVVPQPSVPGQGRPAGQVPAEPPSTKGEAPAKQPIETPVAVVPQSSVPGQGRPAGQVPAEQPPVKGEAPAKQPVETLVAVVPQPSVPGQGRPAGQVPAELPSTKGEAPAKQPVETPVALSPAPVKIEVPAKQPIETPVAVVLQPSVPGQGRPAGQVPAEQPPVKGEAPAKQPVETLVAVVPQPSVPGQGRPAGQVPAELPSTKGEAPAKQPVETPIALSPAPVKIEVPAKQPIETPVAVVLQPPVPGQGRPAGPVPAEQPPVKGEAPAKQPIETPVAVVPQPSVPGQGRPAGQVPAEQPPAQCEAPAKQSIETPVAVAPQSTRPVPTPGDGTIANPKSDVVASGSEITTKPALGDVIVRPGQPDIPGIVRPVQLSQPVNGNVDLPNGIRLQVVDAQGNVAIKVTDLNPTGIRLSSTGDQFIGNVAGRTAADQPIKYMSFSDGTISSTRTIFGGSAVVDGQQSYKADLVMLPSKLATKTDDIQLNLGATAVRTPATESAVSVVRCDQQIHNDVRVTEAPQHQVVDAVVKPIAETTRIAESPLVRQDAIRVTEPMQIAARTIEAASSRSTETRVVSTDQTLKSAEYSTTPAAPAAQKVLDAQSTQVKVADVVRVVDQQTPRAVEPAFAQSRPVDIVKLVVDQPVRPVSANVTVPERVQSQVQANPVDQPVRTVFANVTVPERVQSQLQANPVDQPVRTPVMVVQPTAAVSDSVQVAQVVAEPIKDRVQIAQGTPDIIRETAQISNIHIDNRPNSLVTNVANLGPNGLPQNNSIINDPAGSALHVSVNVEDDLFDALAARNDFAGSEKRELPGLRTVFGLTEFIFGDKDSEQEGGSETKKESSSVPQIAKTVSTHRVKYVVKYGDTLNSIALANLGDSRFADLLITINRAEIHFVDVEGTVTPTVYEGQVIWLPAMAELEIYKKNFFNAKSRSRKAHSGYTPISIERIDNPVMTPVITPILQLTDEDKTVVSAHLTPLVPTVDEAKDVNISLEKLRAQVAEREPIVGSISNRRCYQVRLGETLQSVALRDPVLNDAQLWKLLAIINGLSTDTDEHGRAAAKLVRGQYLVLPTEDEVKEYRLLHKLYASLPKHTRPIVSCTPDSLPINNVPSQEEMPVCFEIEKLADDCRLIIAGSNTGSTVFSIALQLLVSSVWTTIVRYDCNGLGTTRATFDHSGHQRTFNVELPVHVAMQLAMEDLRRNSRKYCDAYIYTTRFQVAQFAAPTIWK